MARKLLMMIYFCIRVLVKVQANDLVSTSFHPSSLPILLPHPSQLDNMKSIFHICLEENMERCENLREEPDNRFFALCILKNYKYCTVKTLITTIQCIRRPIVA